MQSLTFQSPSSEIRSSLAAAMISGENEVVSFSSPCLCSGPVEDWLNRLVDTMRNTLKHDLSEAVSTYEEKPRHQWLFDYCAQVCLARPPNVTVVPLSVVPLWAVRSNFLVANRKDSLVSNFCCSCYPCHFFAYCDLVDITRCVADLVVCGSQSDIRSLISRSSISYERFSQETHPADSAINHSHSRYAYRTHIQDVAIGVTQTSLVTIVLSLNGLARG